MTTQTAPVTTTGTAMPEFSVSIVARAIRATVKQKKTLIQQRNALANLCVSNWDESRLVNDMNAIVTSSFKGLETGDKDTLSVWENFKDGFTRYAREELSAVIKIPFKKIDGIKIYQSATLQLLQPVTEPETVTETETETETETADATNKEASHEAIASSLDSLLKSGASPEYLIREILNLSIESRMHETFLLDLVDHLTKPLEDTTKGTFLARPLDSSPAVNKQSNSDLGNKHLESGK